MSRMQLHVQLSSRDTCGYVHRSVFNNVLLMFANSVCQKLDGSYGRYMIG